MGGIAQGITRQAEARVYVVDADSGSCERLCRLLRDAGYQVQAFATARAFLDVAAFLAADCVLLRMSVPGAADRPARGRRGRQSR